MIRSDHPKAALEEAAIWLARLRSESHTPGDEDMFRRWLDADAANAAAFELVTATWEVAGYCSTDRQPENIHSGVRWRRRTMLLGVGASLAVGGSMLLRNTAEAKTYQTDVGEQKHVALEDGSQVFLDTSTKLVVRLSPSQRLAYLAYGRANFHVTDDGKRPFQITSAEQVISAGGSVLDVRNDEGRVSVTLVQGNAMVAPTGVALHGETKSLTTGERLIAIRAQEPQMDKPDLSRLLAWQTGQAIFDNDSLADAIYEMNRYSTTKLEVADTAIAGLRVSGVYRVGDNVLFARSISKLLPVVVRQEDDRIQLVADKDRMIQG